jgi:hypothetical protein
MPADPASTSRDVSSHLHGLFLMVSVAALLLCPWTARSSPSEVDAIVKGLMSDTPSARVAALKELPDHTGAVGAALLALATADAETSRGAQQALNAAAGASQALRAYLSTYARSPSDCESHSALVALASARQYSKGLARAAIIWLLSESGDTRFEAARLVQHWGCRASGALLEGLASSEGDMQPASCLMLERMGREGRFAGPALLTLAMYGDRYTSVAAARALLGIGAFEAYGKAVLATALRESNENWRRQVTAGGPISVTWGSMLDQPILTLLRSKRPEEVQEGLALAEWARCESTPVYAALLNVLTSAQAELSRSALGTLRRMPLQRPENRALLRQVVRSDTASARAGAVAILRESGAAFQASDVARLLNDESPQVRRETLRYMVLVDGALPQWMTRALRSLNSRPSTEEELLLVALLRRRLGQDNPAGELLVRALTEPGDFGGWRDECVWLLDRREATLGDRLSDSTLRRDWRTLVRCAVGTALVGCRVAAQRMLREALRSSIPGRRELVARCVRELAQRGIALEDICALIFRDADDDVRCIGAEISGELLARGLCGPESALRRLRQEDRLPVRLALIRALGRAKDERRSIEAVLIGLLHGANGREASTSSSILGVASRSGTVSRLLKLARSQDAVLRWRGLWTLEELGYVLRDDQVRLLRESAILDSVSSWSVMEIQAKGTTALNTLPLPSVDVDCWTTRWAWLRSAGTRRGMGQQYEDMLGDPSVFVRCAAAVRALIEGRQSIVINHTTRLIRSESVTDLRVLAIELSRLPPDLEGVASVRALLQQSGDPLVCVALLSRCR